MPFFSFRSFSTQATIAAAVVKDPAGSAKAEISNGFNKRLADLVQHVEGEDGVLAADENAGVDSIPRASAKTSRPGPRA